MNELTKCTIKADADAFMNPKCTHESTHVCLLIRSHVDSSKWRRYYILGFCWPTLTQIIQGSEEIAEAAEDDTRCVHSPHRQDESVEKASQIDNYNQYTTDHKNIRGRHLRYCEMFRTPLIRYKSDIQINPYSCNS